LLGLASSGCSILFTRRAPAGAADGDEPPECTSSVAAPVLDTAMTAVQVARVFYAAQATDYDYRGFPIDRRADLGIGVGLMALFGVSAAYGFATTSTCRRVKKEWLTSSSRTIHDRGPASQPAFSAVRLRRLEVASEAGAKRSFRESLERSTAACEAAPRE
jgi:hypothetical protein